MAQCGHSFFFFKLLIKGETLFAEGQEKASGLPNFQKTVQESGPLLKPVEDEFSQHLLKLVLKKNYSIYRKTHPYSHCQN